MTTNTQQRRAWLARSGIACMGATLAGCAGLPSFATLGTFGTLGKSRPGTNAPAGVEPAPGAPPPADLSRLPPYRRAANASGTLKLSGSSAVAPLARVWAAAFMRMYPNTRIDVITKSSGTAIVDMSADAATLGMTSRPLNRSERDGYATRFGRAPTEVKVAIDALAIFVFKDNPLPHITLDHVERIFAATPRRGAALERWGQLDVAGEWTREWASRRIVPIGFQPGRGAYDLMRELVLQGGDFGADVSAEPVASSVVQAVAVDPGAIGYASASLRTARTRLLPVVNADGKPIAPDEAGAASGRYPLARFLYVHLGQAATPGVDALAREFMRLVLSQDGQDLARASGAFAITPALAHQQVA